MGGINLATRKQINDRIGECDGRIDKLRKDLGIDHGQGLLVDLENSLQKLVDQLKAAGINLN